MHNRPTSDGYILPDVLAPGLRVVFCGTAASPRSAAMGAYYAGPGNRFWPTLYEIGLIPQPLKPPQFREVLCYGIGLTDLVKTVSGVDSSLTSTDFDVPALQKKIDSYMPHVLALTSKRAARVFLGRAQIEYGFQTETLGKTRVFVLPSPSGAARAAWDSRHWQVLADSLLD